MNDRPNEALRATSRGDQSALNKLTDVIIDNLHAAVIIFKVRLWVFNLICMTRGQFTSLFALPLYCRAYIRHKNQSIVDQSFRLLVFWFQSTSAN